MSDAVRDPFADWTVGRMVPLPSVLPKGWTISLLTHVARLESGHTPSRRRPDYWGGEVPWVSLHDVGRLSKPEISDTLEKITKLGLANSSARLLPAGTVIFSRTASVGKSTVLAKPMATTQDFANFVCGPEVYCKYLMYLFRYNQATWKQLMAGSIHNTIYMPVFKALQVLLPPRAEQQAIAEVLEDADALIEGLEALIAKKRDIKEGAMQELLTGDRRLPGFEGEWVTKKLGDVGEVVNGLTYSPTDISESGLIVLRSSNVQGGTLAFADIVRVKADVAAAAFVTKGDILICVRNGSRDMIGKCALIPDHAEKMAFGAFMAVVRAHQPEFIFQVFQSAYMKRQIAERLGATINQITNASLRCFEVRMPPTPDEQRAIAKVLSDMDAEIAALADKLTKARAVKHGMMQVLLTGEIRLK